MRLQLISFYLLVIIGVAFPNSINIKSIEINKKEVSVNDWKSLSLTVQDEITFFIDLSMIENRDAVQFKVYLNALPIPNEVDVNGDASVRFNSLTEDVYIFKVVAYLNNGNEIETPAIKFIVTDKPINKPVSASDSNNSNYIYVFGVIIILIFLAVWFLLKARKADVKIANVRNEKDEVDKRISSLYSELKKEKDENHFLQKQILDLKSDIENLEKSNEELLVQNERLENSKQQLSELQAEKEKLFAITLHDIKNPASAINGYIDLLNRYDFNAIEQQDILQSLAASSMQIISLSQKMSRVLVAKKKEEADELNLNSASLKVIIDQVCKRNYAYAKNKNVELINNASLHTPDINVDPLKIDEALDNYVSNAIKFSPENAVVKVSSYFSEKKVFVEVTDNGPGLTKWDSENAFQKGKTLSAKPTGGESSTGMGLWIVKQIVEQHEGEVWVKSKVGYGATFGFNLPI
ncbi:MAG: ATP-binding protein [Ignavibacteria bacterium]|nr:ATP-binding protein [Ignavibacteria bacterium]